MRKIFLMVLLLSIPTVTWATPDFCSYTTYKWNVLEKKAMDVTAVKHSYSSLEDYEIDPNTGCTVCEEDQEIIEIGSLPPFKVCGGLATVIRNAFNQFFYENQPIFKIMTTV